MSETREEDRSRREGSEAGTRGLTTSEMHSGSGEAPSSKSKIVKPKSKIQVLKVPNPELKLDWWG